MGCIGMVGSIGSALLMELSYAICSSSIFESPEYVIYEMENDCSKWFVKHRLDINLIVTAFPDEMIEDKENNSSNSLLELEEFISPVSLVEVENEGSLLVMYIPGRFISYRFKDNTFKTIREILPSSTMSSSANVIGSNNDIIMEILLHLPARSLIKVKLVSRKWLNLTSDPYFIGHHCRQSAKTISGFILNCALHFNLKFPPYIQRDESCNPCIYYIFNPATNKFSILHKPVPLEYSISYFSLAYDPTISPFYQENILQVQKPQFPENWNPKRVKHFMECQGHLFFIVFDSPEYIIYEMEKDCWKWFVKHRLDINLIVSGFSSQMIEVRESVNSICRGLPDVELLIFNNYICPVSVVDDKNKGPALVMFIPGRFISYRFKDNTMKTICEVEFDESQGFEWFHTFNYVETLSDV
ncbi:hypothetical protein COLO4_29641 [Corchorus olitorius]|uniref:F-box domain-containing protein n=1 Tax=Corchorus olitorius TaxID=93759 RepID=A0A1R3HDR7_9ROSI|nr:hypothetical protein COLO4_29641 [Corchorus olitorius]